VFSCTDGRATDQDLVHSFRRIAKGEKLAVDDATLLAIAKLSDGSFRDGAKLLEELVFAAQARKSPQHCWKRNTNQVG